MIDAAKTRLTRFRNWWHRDLLAQSHDQAARTLGAVERVTDSLVNLPHTRPPEPPVQLPATTPTGIDTWPDEDRLRIEDRGLFVIGGARSGTTILYETINLSPEIYLLGEPDLHLNAARAEFVEFLSQRHAGWGNLKAKGHYAARAVGPSGTGFDLLRHLVRRHRYVGAKVAIGPSVGYDPNELELLLRFHATHFFHSQYVLTIRHPWEVAASMTAKWPEPGVRHHLKVWTLAARFLLEASLVFPRVLVLPHERLNEGAVGHLARELGVALPVPPGRFAAEYQASADARTRLPTRLAAERPILTRMADVYRGVCAAFDPETLRYAGRQNPRQWAQDVWDRLDQILGDLAQDRPSTIRLVA